MSQSLTQHIAGLYFRTTDILLNQVRGAELLKFSCARSGLCDLAAVIPVCLWPLLHLEVNPHQPLTEELSQ